MKNQRKENKNHNLFFIIAVSAIVQMALGALQAYDLINLPRLVIVIPTFVIVFVSLLRIFYWHIVGYLMYPNGRKKAKTLKHEKD